MFVEFKAPWGRHAAGDLADLETTLARRLVGLGLAAYPDRARKTTPQAMPAEPKGKPKTRYKRPEKAVTIEP